MVMPRTTPALKVDSVRALGGKAILHGDAYDDAREHAYALAAEKGAGEDEDALSFDIYEEKRSLLAEPDPVRPLLDEAVDALLARDEGAAALDAAIASYRQRERRFGRTSEQLAPE